MEAYKEIIIKLEDKIKRPIWVTYDWLKNSNDMSIEAELCLRGILLSVSTAKAIWGEEQVTVETEEENGGRTKEEYLKLWINGEFKWANALTIPAWQYHNAITANMESVSEILEYISKYL